MLDVGPCCDDRGEDHQAEGEERHAGHAAAEPKHLAVGDQDDGQVLEDGVDWDGKELNGFAAGVDHSDQKERDGEPWYIVSLLFFLLALIGWPIVHFFASSLLKSRYVMRFIDLQVPIATTQTTLCS